MRQMTSYVSPGYAENLNGLAEGNMSVLVADIRDGKAISTAQLASGPDHYIDYVDTRKSPQPIFTLLPGYQPANDTDPPLFYVPGFTEGITAKVPFAVELAARGQQVILPDQHRVGRTTVADAPHIQAMNYLAIIGNEGLQEKRVNIFAHSFGALIAQDMVKTAQQMEWTCFDDADVILGAPAGVGRKTSVVNLGLRFNKMLASERSKYPKDFPDTTKEMLAAGTRVFKANPVRAAKEILCLHKNRIDFEEFCSRVGQVTVLGYGDDYLFTHEILESGIDDLLEAGGSYATPVRFTDSGRDSLKKSTHNDEQFNADRVAGATVDVLRQR